MSGTNEDLQIGHDPETQDMVKKAEEHFPNLEKADAIQNEADMGPGRVGKPGEGSTMGSVVESAKETVAGVADTLKQANPATRDTREKHC